ncbi:hypothetical protein C1H46_007933 [Malus baccata]|uniref:Uncharacterized protein n=1 Tax=Malus baccata TaxID=106549 RepID=A0A540N5X1_MALBA|nr:hypothetical protein C1H46_007933 [Malus baccata]
MSIRSIGGTARTMQEHVWQVMPRLPRRVVERQFNGLVVLEFSCIVDFTLECTIL